MLTISIGVYHGSSEVANIGGSLDSKLLGAREQMGKTGHPPASPQLLLDDLGWLKNLSSFTPKENLWA